jgi:hypothetical protein
MTEFSAVDLSEEEGMQWQAVDSSQISKIGYASGSEYPLGIRFPQTKKQKENVKNGKPFPLPGSEYHYANVTPELHAEFLAAKTNPDYDNSIGIFFGRVIKSRPDLYPFVNVEEDPTQPRPRTCSTPSTTGITSSETQSTTDILFPGTALALIDSMDDDLLFTPGKVTDAQLATMRSDWLAEAKKYDISTEKARTELKRFARPLQKLRTGIEARAKELTGATKRKIAAIDSEKRRLVQIVGGIETEVLAPMTAWEQEEETRKISLSAQVSYIVESGNFQNYPDIASLGVGIAKLEAFDVSTMQEYKVSAESAIAASLRVLKPELERRKVAEANEAELAELRRKQAERDEADRLAEQKRQEDARVAAAVEAAKVAIWQEVIAELTVPVEPQTIPGKWQDSGTSAVEQAVCYPEIPVAEDKVTIENSIIRALMEHTEANHGIAMSVVEAIAKGLIPHVTITY